MNKKLIVVFSRNQESRTLDHAIKGSRCWEIPAWEHGLVEYESKKKGAEVS